MSPLEIYRAVWNIGFALIVGSKLRSLAPNARRALSFTMWWLSKRIWNVVLDAVLWAMIVSVLAFAAQVLYRIQ